MKRNQIIEQANKAALKKLRSKLYKIFGCRSIAVIEHFSGVKDPRSAQGKRHPLLSVIVIALCAVTCGADGWTQIEEFGKDRQSWFESFLDLPHGKIRKCWVSTDIEWLDQKEKWKDIKSLIRIESERVIQGKSSIEVRYYISSLNEEPDAVLKAI